MNRRKFIQKTSIFTGLLAWHRHAQANSSAFTKVTNNQHIGRFNKITLFTDKLAELYSYYTADLGFHLVERTDEHFIVEIGSSQLQFTKSTEENLSPYYHFAINIPTNKFIEGKSWLQNRTPLLVDIENDVDEMYFESWDAHAVYFKDPAGNIGELIARHSLDNATEGDFTIDDLLCISEIGTPASDPTAFGTDLNYSFGLSNYLGSDMFIGDEYGMFVIPPTDRPWIPEKTQAAVPYPLEAHISDKELKAFEVSIYPYKISGL